MVKKKKLNENAEIFFVLSILDFSQGKRNLMLFVSDGSA